MYLNLEQQTWFSLYKEKLLINVVSNKILQRLIVHSWYLSFNYQFHGINFTSLSYLLWCILTLFYVLELVTILTKLSFLFASKSFLVKLSFKQDFVTINFSLTESLDLQNWWLSFNEQDPYYRNYFVQWIILINKPKRLW